MLSSVSLMIEKSNQYLILINFHLKLHESKGCTVVITSQENWKDQCHFLGLFKKSFIERATRRKVIAFYTPLSCTKGIAVPVHQ